MTALWRIQTRCALAECAAGPAVFLPLTLPAPPLGCRLLQKAARCLFKGSRSAFKGWKGRWVSCGAAFQYAVNLLSPPPQTHLTGLAEWSTDIRAGMFSWIKLLNVDDSHVC
jgi:hypothetical protein